MRRFTFTVCPPDELADEDLLGGAVAVVVRRLRRLRRLRPLRVPLLMPLFLKQC